MYYTLKTIFLLYLALPQTKGSSYIYVYHLQPFFHSHESQIDATLASVKSRVYTFLQERIRALWEQISASIGQQQQQANIVPTPGAGNSAQPPTLNNPASGPVQLAASLWTSYGPGILASGAAILRQTAAAAAIRPSANPTALNTPPGSTFGVDREREERRRQLQAQLDALDRAHAPIPVPIPSASPQISTSRHSSDSDIHVRERTTSGRFEEIGIPSDVEGYDVNEGSDTGGSSLKRGNSWFGWGGSSSKGGYERVKSE